MELKDPESNQMGKHWRGGTTQTSILNVQSNDTKQSVV